MHFSGRYLAYSAIAASLIYYLCRKKRKPIQFFTTEPVFEDILFTECAEFFGEYFELPEFSSHTVDGSDQVLSVPKITICSGVNGCLSTVTQKSYLSSSQLSTKMTALQVLKPETEIPVNVELYEGSAESGSEHAHTPSSDGSTSLHNFSRINNLPPGCFNDPSNDIFEDSPEELNGTMVPKVLIPSDMWAEAVDQDIWHETFCVPAHMGGVLIGRLGKNVRELKNIWGAEFCLNTCPGRQDTLVFKLSCPLKHKNDVLRWVSKRFRMRPSRTPIGNPNQLKRCLPLGEAVPVQIRSLYAAKEFFLTIQDEEYVNYLNMQTELDKDYSSLNNFRMQLCEPVTSGTVAVVPHSQGFARALVLSVHSTWPKTVSYFLLDHGTFGIVVLNKLRKIKAKYMRTPFQAIHVSWAHAFPTFSDVPDIHILRTFFATGRVHAFAVRMETCCRASVAFGQPYPPPYSNNGLMDVLVNACNSGLYMTVPLALYPNRQSWLNGTGIPYYPFAYSAIDYSLLVGYIPDDPSAVLPNMQPSPNEDAAELDSSNNNTVPSAPNNSQYRGGGSRSYRPAGWSQRNNTGRFGTAPKISQKENEPSTMHPKPTATSSENAEPKRRPLGVRNARGSSASAGYRGTASRGRTQPLPLRSRD